jgi:hypothetical protein
MTTDRASDDTNDPEVAAAGGPNSPRDIPEDSPLDPLLRNLSEIQEYFSHYVDAQKDELKATAHRWAILVLVEFTILVTAVIFVMNGLATAITIATGGHLWVGELVVGLVMIIGFSPISKFIVNRLSRSAARAMRGKYESRHRRQRAEFGTDATQRAAS